MQLINVINFKFIVLLIKPLIIKIFFKIKEKKIFLFKIKIIFLFNQIINLNNTYYKKFF